MSSPSSGRVVVITGANEGIGYHLAEALLEDGYRVAGFDVDVTNLEALAATAPESFRAHECDLRSGEAVDRAVSVVLEEWDAIDILVNNAAIFHFDLFADRTLDDTRDEIDVNLLGALRTIHAVLPHMRERGEGIVHNVSSGAGLVGHPGLSGYAATKGGIVGLTRSLQLELQHEAVASTVMYPPLTATRSAAELDYPARYTAEPADVGRKLAGKIESTRETIYADWSTRLGMWVARRFPVVVRRASRRFLTGGRTDRAIRR